MRARPSGVLKTAGATSLALLLAACGAPAAAHGTAIGAASPNADAATSTAPAASAPRSSGAPSARRSAAAKPGQSSAPKAAAAAHATIAGGTSGTATGNTDPTTAASPTTHALSVDTKCRKSASSVGNGVALPRSKPAPFTGTRTDCDGTLDFSSYTNGKPTLVTFFASWCDPCHKEAKDLEAVYEEYHASKGFQVVAVDTQDESGSPAWFYTNAHWSFPAVWDDGEKIEKAWNQSGATSTLPASFWIHPDGTISSIDSGQMSRSKMEDEFNKL